MECFSPPRENFLYFRNGNPEKTFYIFSRESFSYISEKGNPKKIYILEETETLNTFYISESNFPT